MIAYDTIQEAGAERGWDMDTMLLIACEYIDNQQAGDAFQDHLKQKIAEEDEMSAEEEVP